MPYIKSKLLLDMHDTKFFRGGYSRGAWIVQATSSKMKCVFVLPIFKYVSKHRFSLHSVPCFCSAGLMFAKRVNLFWRVSGGIYLVTPLPYSQEDPQIQALSRSRYSGYQT